MAAKHGLGRGLGALIKDGMVEQRPAAETGTAGVARIPVERIAVSKRQPRRAFNEEALNELAASIRRHGVLQPVLVRAAGPDTYELIAGERRLRAASVADLKEVPAIVTEAAEQRGVELALVENLQREDLNPLEEAHGYELLSSEFGLTQEQIADRVGKARATVSNAMRLLSLPDEVMGMIARGELSAGHAKLLSGLTIADEQVLYARRAVADGLSVHNLEKLIRRGRRAPRKPRATRDDMPRSHVGYLSDRLHHHLGTAVRITPSRTLANGKKRKGLIEIDFYSNDDLDRILALLGIQAE